jgi:double zinc ribbon protein
MRPVTLAAPMGPIAVFGIENDGLNLAANLLLLFIVVLWLALVFWTYSDARRRIADPMLVGCATAASLFPFIGTVVYMIVRPPEYLEDVRERELEIAAAEARLATIEQLSCPFCGFDVEKSFLRCPSCLRRLKEPCTVCGKPLDPRWKICPYCEAEVGAAAPARATDPGRRPRPRRTTPRPTAERPPGRAAERYPQRPAERPSDRSGERLSDRSGERLSDRSGERLSDRSGERRSERSAERGFDGSPPPPARPPEGAPKPARPARERPGPASG